MDLQYLVTTAEFGVYAFILSVLLACFVFCVVFVCVCTTVTYSIIIL